MSAKRHLNQQQFGHHMTSEDIAAEQQAAIADAMHGMTGRLHDVAVKEAEAVPWGQPVG